MYNPSRLICSGVRHDPSGRRDDDDHNLYHAYIEYRSLPCPGAIVLLITPRLCSPVTAVVTSRSHVALREVVASITAIASVVVLGRSHVALASIVASTLVSAIVTKVGGFLVDLVRLLASVATTASVSAIAAWSLRATRSTGAIVIHRRLLSGALSHLAWERLVRLTHLRVAEVHLSIKVVGQAAIVVKAAEVGTAHIANLQLLVARGTRSVRERLKLPLLLRLGLGHDLEVVPLVHGQVDLADSDKDFDLFDAALDVFVDVGNGFKLPRWSVTDLG